MNFLSKTALGLLAAAGLTALLTPEAEARSRHHHRGHSYSRHHHHHGGYGYRGYRGYRAYPRVYYRSYDPYYYPGYYGRGYYSRGYYGRPVISIGFGGRHFHRGLCW